MTATTRTSAADRRLTVTVGPAEELDVTEITATRPVWTGCVPASGARRLPGPAARPRRGPLLHRLAGRRDDLHDPPARVAKGQAAVL